MEEQKKRRSSILKPQKPRNPLSDLPDLGLPEPAEDQPTLSKTTANRRVSFAGTNLVKEFVTDAESNTTFWNTTYEERINKSDSSQSIENTNSHISTQCSLQIGINHVSVWKERDFESNSLRDQKTPKFYFSNKENLRCDDNLIKNTALSSNRTILDDCNMELTQNIVDDSVSNVENPLSAHNFESHENELKSYASNKTIIANESMELTQELPFQSQLDLVKQNKTCVGNESMEYTSTVGEKIMFNQTRHFNTTNKAEMSMEFTQPVLFSVPVLKLYNANKTKLSEESMDMTQKMPIYNLHVQDTNISKKFDVTMEFTEQIRTHTQFNVPNQNHNTTKPNNNFNTTLSREVSMELTQALPMYNNINNCSINKATPLSQPMPTARANNYNVTQNHDMELTQLLPAYPKQNLTSLGSGGKGLGTFFLSTEAEQDLNLTQKNDMSMELTQEVFLGDIQSVNRTSLLNKDIESANRLFPVNKDTNLIQVNPTEMSDGTQVNKTHLNNKSLVKSSQEPNTDINIKFPEVASLQNSSVLMKAGTPQPNNLEGSDSEIEINKTRVINKTAAGTSLNVTKVISSKPCDDEPITNIAKISPCQLLLDEGKEEFQNLNVSLANALNQDCEIKYNKNKEQIDSATSRNRKDLSTKSKTSLIIKACKTNLEKKNGAPPKPKGKLKKEEVAKVTSVKLKNKPNSTALVKSTITSTQLNFSKKGNKASSKLDVEEKICGMNNAYTAKPLVPLKEAPLPSNDHNLRESFQSLNLEKSETKACIVNDIDISRLRTPHSSFHISLTPISTFDDTQHLIHYTIGSAHASNKENTLTRNNSQTKKRRSDENIEVSNPTKRALWDDVLSNHSNETDINLVQNESFLESSSLTTTTTTHIISNPLINAKVLERKEIWNDCVQRNHFEDKFKPFKHELKVVVDDCKNHLKILSQLADEELAALSKSYKEPCVKISTPTLDSSLEDDFLPSDHNLRKMSVVKMDYHLTTEEFLCIDKAILQKETKNDGYWSLFFVEKDKCEFSTLYKTIRVKVEFVEESGCIKQVDVQNCISDTSDRVSLFLHKIFNQLLLKENIRTRLGDQYDILSLLDYVSMNMRKIIDFLEDVTKFKKYYGLEIDENSRVHFEINSLPLRFSWRISVDLSDLCNINENNISAHATIGSVKEDEIKSLVHNSSKGILFLRSFVVNVLNYVKVLLKQKRIKS